jgi:hypothetical protein
MRRPARVLVSGQVAASASDRELRHRPSDPARNWHVTRGRLPRSTPRRTGARRHREVEPAD